MILGIVCFWVYHICIHGDMLIAPMIFIMTLLEIIIGWWLVFPFELVSFIFAGRSLWYPNVAHLHELKGHRPSFFCKASSQASGNNAHSCWKLLVERWHISNSPHKSMYITSISHFFCWFTSFNMFQSQFSSILPALSCFFNASTAFPAENTSLTVATGLRPDGLLHALRGHRAQRFAAWSPGSGSPRPSPGYAARKTLRIRKTLR